MAEEQILQENETAAVQEPVQEAAPVQETAQDPVQEETPVQETASEPSAEDKKTDKEKTKSTYHLILFIDNKKDGGVHQMGISRGFVQILAGIIALALLVTIIGWKVNSSKREQLQLEKETLTAQVEDLQSQVDTLTADNQALSDKVSILSETVTTKVEQENIAQKESDEAHFPQGFPLSASASMTTSEDDPKCLIFGCSEGSSIIAAGDGVVLEVIPDVDYGYCIRIDHENGYITEYYTSSTPLIKEGDSVLQGAILALVEGKNAKLIYKVYQDDKQIDPMEVIKIDG